MRILDLTVENFDDEVLSVEGKVLVDFWAAWCGPCRMLSPIVDEVAENNDNVKVCKVNVDNEQELAIKYGVMSIPTLLLFENGKLVNKSIGLVSKEKIENMIK
ncbi:MAG: thioredoxin [Clostridia bacterium]|nr:thioredoxin [Clostridia bacterium]MBR2875459.1 thioredoxin [Clostridia bacterium]MBR6692687.1 thioredoxin [Clostridia bacterium]